MRRIACVVALVLTSAALSGCGLRGELSPILTPVPSNANLLKNPGFESGDSPWQIDPSAAKVTDARAHTGARSLSMDFSSNTESGVRASQPLPGAAIPEFVSGFYRVDAWNPAGVNLYSEFFVSVRGGGFADGADEHVLHVSIAGTRQVGASEPQNGVVFLSRDPPKTDAWIYFAYPVAQAFEARYGKAQDTVRDVSIGIEVTAELPSSNTRALAYFDDLYAGPQAANPNRPVDD